MYKNMQLCATAQGKMAAIRGCVLDMYTQHVGNVGIVGGGQAHHGGRAAHICKLEAA